jgi:hypothetical protein
MRTPYSCAPYGTTEFKKSIGPSETMMNEGYYRLPRRAWTLDE